MNLPSARELDPGEHDLVALATRTIDENSDAGPGEDGLHTVGAAVLTAGSQMFPAVNLHHFTGGPCAELVALGAARAGGARHVVAIVAVGNNGRGVLAPCGRDRQVLVDHYPTARVIVETPEGLRSVSCSDLLPGAYRSRDAFPAPGQAAPMEL